MGCQNCANCLSALASINALCGKRGSLDPTCFLLGAGWHAPCCMNRIRSSTPPRGRTLAPSSLHRCSGLCIWGLTASGAAACVLRARHPGALRSSDGWARAGAGPCPTRHGTGRSNSRCAAVERIQCDVPRWHSVAATSSTWHTSAMNASGPGVVSPRSRSNMHRMCQDRSIESAIAPTTSQPEAASGTIQRLLVWSGGGVFGLLLKQ